jgi:hypothetical protein
MLSSSFVAVAASAEEDHSGHDMGDHDMTEHAAHTGAAAHIHHRHQQGAWMVEYRFMRMSMSDLRDGTNGVDTRDISGVLPGMPPVADPTKPYRMSPTDMTMDMHMLMVMYGLTERVSLMGMAAYRENEMDMVMHMPIMDMFGTMETDGLGDTLIGAMLQLEDNWTVSASLSLPTGDIDERVDMRMTGVNPMTGMPMTVVNQDIKAGYPMQLGSGTYDLIPAVTYTRSYDGAGWGFQASYVWRIGENDNDYTLGNVAEVFGWGKYVVNPRLLLSSKLAYKNWGRIDGQDPEINPAMSPVNDPRATGGQRLDFSVGANTFFGDGHSLGIEFGLPVYQDLNGPQMEMDWILSFVYQYM